MIPEQAVRLGVPDGVSLEARVALVPGAPAGLVVCHPHPLYGGDMDNPVVVRVADVGGELGLATLRFNFRGVGGSTGSHGGGEAEEADVEAALGWMTQHVERVALVGYSFGAAVCAAVGARWPRVAGLALVAPAIGAGTGRPGRTEGGLIQMLGAGTGRPVCTEGGLIRLLGSPGAPSPVLIVAGDSDEYCPVGALHRLRRELPRAHVQIVAGANHFFFGKLFPLGEAIREWARRLAPGTS